MDDKESLSDMVLAHSQAVNIGSAHVRERWLHVLFEQTAMSIIFLEHSGVLFDLSPSFCDLLGYTREALLQIELVDVIFPEDQALYQAYLHRVVMGEVSRQAFDIRVLERGGAYHWLHFVLARAHHDQEKDAPLIGFVEDIHDRIIQEAAQVYSAGKKDSRNLVSEDRRKSPLSLTVLREENHQMDNFLGIAGHELRNPLTTIKANIQLSMRRLKDLTRPGLEVESVHAIRKIETVSNMLERAERQVDVLNRLVGDVLDISRIRAGRLQLNLHQEPCDLIHLVLDVMQKQRQTIPERTITVSVPDHASALVFADQERIEQVVVNYLSNALKYSEKQKPIEVFVTFEKNDDGDPREVKVAIRDQGQGLSQIDQERVWECFYQSPSVHVLSGSGVGLGLGLHISQSIIALHHGCVGMSSVVGVGSTFWFILPLMR